MKTVRYQREEETQKSQVWKPVFLRGNDALLITVNYLWHLKIINRTLAGYIYMAIKTQNTQCKESGTTLSMEEWLPEASHFQSVSLRAATLLYISVSSMLTTVPDIKQEQNKHILTNKNQNNQMFYIKNLLTWKTRKQYMLMGPILKDFRLAHQLQFHVYILGKFYWNLLLKYESLKTKSIYTI